MNILLRNSAPLAVGFYLLVDMLYPDTWFYSAPSESTESDLHQHKKFNILSSVLKTWKNCRKIFITEFPSAMGII